jgi:hypothetical protein
MAKRKLIAIGTTDGLVTSGRCSVCKRPFLPKTGERPSPKTIHSDLLAAFEAHNCREDASQAAARVVRESTEDH